MRNSEDKVRTSEEREEITDFRYGYPSVGGPGIPAGGMWSISVGVPTPPQASPPPLPLASTKLPRMRVPAASREVLLHSSSRRLILMHSARKASTRHAGLVCSRPPVQAPPRPRGTLLMPLVSSRTVAPACVTSPGAPLREAALLENSAHSSDRSNSRFTRGSI